MTSDKVYLIGHHQVHSSLVTTRFIAPWGECTHISLCAMMHHMDTGEAVVTSL